MTTYRVDILMSLLSKWSDETLEACGQLADDLGRKDDDDVGDVLQAFFKVAFELGFRSGRSEHGDAVASLLDELGAIPPEGLTETLEDLRLTLYIGEHPPVEGLS